MRVMKDAEPAAPHFLQQMAPVRRQSVATASPNGGRPEVDAPPPLD